MASGNLSDRPHEVAKFIMHELLHPFVADVNGDDHSEIDLIMSSDFKNIWGESGKLFNINDHQGQISYEGSRYDDSQMGGSGNDVVAGMGGNDSLAGGGGFDLVIGGIGMDVLSGGSGANQLMGGLDADTYRAATGVLFDFIVDDGGVDHLDLSQFSIEAAASRRSGDSLLILFYGTGEQFEIHGQYLEGSKIDSSISRK